MTDDGGMTVSDDPILVKRARIARLVSSGNRYGWGSYGLSTVFFLWAVLGRATTRLATASAAFLILGSILLLPAIIFGYAVKAAERDDRQRAAARAGRDGGRRPEPASAPVDSDPAHADDTPT